MLNQRHKRWTSCGVAVSAILLATPARADFTSTNDVSFVSNGNDPWAPGESSTFGPKAYELVNIPSATVNIGPFNASPTEIVLNAVSEFLGVPLPDFDVVDLEVGGTVTGSAYVGATLYATAGELDINYPGRASLNFQTAGSGFSAVQARHTYNIGSSFQPGVVERHVTEPASIGGPGYNSPLQWSGLTYDVFNEPKFHVKPPDFKATLVAKADVNAGIYGKVEVAEGYLYEGRTDYTIGGPVGGTIVEISPKGLFLYGQDTGLFNATQPIDIPLTLGATARVSYPNLEANGALASSNSTELYDDNVTEVFRINADIEKLIPVIGPILHNSLGPLTYDLAHLNLAPIISVYQEFTYTPQTLVKLKFSEPVLVGGNPTKEVEFPLSQPEPVQWTPMFNNSSAIIITPEYTMNNTFKNETGLALSFEIDFDALGFDAPFLPEYQGPIINPPPATFELARVALYEREPWQIVVDKVHGNAITIPKYNAVPGLEDVHLTLATLSSGSSENGPAVYDLIFSQSVPVGPPKQYQLTVPGTSFLLETGIACDGTTCDEGTIKSGVFTALQDVVLTDPVTSQQYNLGTTFCLYGCNLSAGLDDPSPAFIVEDPNNPGQFLPPLYVPYLDAIPYTPVDVENHPILGVPTLDQTNGVAEVMYGAAIVDRRNQPLTTIMVQSIDITPEGDARFGPLPKVLINNSGAIAVQGALALFVETLAPGLPALYMASEAGRVKLARAGDPTPGGGTVQLGNSPFSRVDDVSEIGVVAFQANGSDSNQRGVYLGRTDGVALVARHGQSIPSGAGFFYFTETEIPVAINSVYDVAFATSWSSTPGGAPTGYGVFRGNGNSSLVEIAEVGIDPLGNTGILTQILNNVDVNDSGDVSFLAQTTLHPNLGVYRGNGQSVVAIALPDGPAPFGSTFRRAYSGVTPRINNSGQVAFVGEILMSIGSSAAAVYRGNGAQLTQIAVAGQFGTPAPDLDGVLAAIQPSVQVELNDAGQVAFFGSVAGATSYNAIFRGDGTNLTRIARTGQAAPDGDGTFQYLGAGSEVDFELNNQGHVAFFSDLVNTTHNQGLFVFDGTNVVQVVRNGQSLAGSTVTSFSGPSLNDQMQVAYRAHLADGREVAARFEPTMYWRNAGSGSWGTGTNWSLRVEPTNPYDVFIVAENALTVTGPAVNRTVKSLSIGNANTASATLFLASGTTLTTTNGTAILPNGGLGGSGALAGDVTNSGTVVPGSSALGPLHISGDYVQHAAGILGIAIGSPTSVGRLDVTGSLSLGGTLSVGFIDEDNDGNIYSPAVGASFNVLDWTGNLSGTFSTLQLPTLGADLMWYTGHLYTTGALSVALAGDFNFSGRVDAADYVVWRKDSGGIYTQNNYSIWRAHFGQPGGGSGASANAAVPEPATLVLLMFAAAGWCVRRGHAA